MSPTAAAASSSARQILQRRAIQCSFSSVFHLRNTVINSTDKKQAAEAMKQVKDVERIFITAVAMPVYFMGFVGALAYGHKQWK
jgi:hypothetical protein